MQSFTEALNNQPEGFVFRTGGKDFTEPVEANNHSYLNNWGVTTGRKVDMGDHYVLVDLTTYAPAYKLVDLTTYAPAYKLVDLTTYAPAYKLVDTCNEFHTPAGRQ